MDYVGGKADLASIIVTPPEGCLIGTFHRLAAEERLAELRDQRGRTHTP